MASIDTPRTPSRTPILTILAVGTLIAAGCAFGPAWLVRLGLGIAILTAVAAVGWAWRQMDQMVVDHMLALKAVQDESREQLRAAAHEHHVEAMAMIARFNRRRQLLEDELEQARAEMAELRGSLASAELDAEAKQTRITALSGIVSELEHQIAAADSSFATSHGVIELPRRGASRRQLEGLDLSRLPLVYPSTGRRQA